MSSTRRFRGWTTCVTLMMGVATIFGCDGGSNTPGDENTAPVASNTSITVTADVGKTIELPATDIDNDSLTCTIVTQPTHGTLTIDGTTATYTPAAGYSGSDSFAFKVSDGIAESDVATVTITVSAGTATTNTAPVAANLSASTAEDIARKITLAATDADNDTLTYAIVTQPSHGTVTLSGTTATYTPASKYIGSDSFTYKANDGIADSNTAKVTITVAAGGTKNTAPVATDGSLTIAHDVKKIITLTATDADSDPLSTSIVTEPAHGTVGLMGNVATYTPEGGYTGEDSFTFKANDGLADSNVATVKITITNAAAVAIDGTLTTSHDVAKSITLVATDADSDGLTTSIVDLPAHGTVTISLGEATYTPAAGYVGADSFTFSVHDGVIDSNVATISINVTNATPVAADQTVSAEKNSPTAIALSATDGDGDTLTYSVKAQPTHGVVSISGTTATYTPVPGYSGTDSFLFCVNDGLAESNSATVMVNVRTSWVVNTTKGSAPTGACDGLLTAVLADKSTIVAGEFSGVCQLTGKSVTIPLTCSSNRSGLVAKYDADGELVWAKSINGPGNVFVTGISACSDGSFAIVGYYYNGIIIFPEAATLVPLGGTDIFVARYNADGTCAWAKSFGGTGEDHGKSVAVGSDGAVYFGGYFNASVLFGSTMLSSSGQSDAFLAKYAADGSFVWAKKWGTGGYDLLRDIAVGSDGSLYAVGSYQGSLSMARVLLPWMGGKDGFIVKLNAAGTEEWASAVCGFADDECGAVAAIPGGGCYVQGYFSAAIVFPVSLTPVGGTDIFVAKFDASGNTDFVKAFGSSSNEYVLDGAYGDIAALADRSFVSAFTFGGVMTVGSAVLFPSAPATCPMALIRGDASGNVVWAKRSVGTATYAIPRSIAISADESRMAVGIMAAMGTFTLGETQAYETTLSLSNEQSGVLAMFNLNGILASRP